MFSYIYVNSVPSVFFNQCTTALQCTTTNAFLLKFTAYSNFFLISKDSELHHEMDLNPIQLLPSAALYEKRRSKYLSIA